MHLIVTRNSELTHTFMVQHATLIHPGTVFDVWLYEPVNGVTIDDVIAGVGTDWLGSLRVQI